METKLVDLGVCKLHVPADDKFFGNERFLRNYIDEVDHVYSLLKSHRLIGNGDGNTMIDIGACMGISCIPALKRGYFESAIAFEPHFENFVLLKKNVHENELRDRFRYFLTAVGDYTGLVELRRGNKNYKEKNSGAWSLKIGAENKSDEVGDTVSVVRLRDIICGQDRIALVWADCQGSEPFILKDSRQILEGVPWYIEVEVPFLEHFNTLDMLIEEVTRRFSYYIDIRGDWTAKRIDQFEGIYEVIRSRRHKMTNVLLIP